MPPYISGDLNFYTTADTQKVEKEHHNSGECIKMCVSCSEYLWNNRIFLSPN